MSQHKAFQHMAAWAIQNLFNTYKEASEILADTELSETDKALKLKGPNGTDHRMLNLLLLLKPVLAEAKSEFPEQAAFFEWFKERCDYVDGLNILPHNCQCKGCREETVDELSTVQ